MTLLYPGADDDGPACTEGCDAGQCGCPGSDELIAEMVSVGYCHNCDNECEWVECDVCGGEGGSCPHEYSPIEYGPEDWDECEQCEGQGGWQVCRTCEGEPETVAVLKAAAAMTRKDSRE
jgi:hypothetical protein